MRNWTYQKYLQTHQKSLETLKIKSQWHLEMWWTTQDAWHSIRIDTCKNIRRCQHTQDKQKSPSPPAGAETWHTGEVDCLGNITDAWTFTQMCRVITTTWKQLKSWAKPSEVSSEAKEVKLTLQETLKHPSLRRQVRIERINVCTENNMPIKALDTQGQKFIFGWAVDNLRC